MTDSSPDLVETSKERERVVSILREKQSFLLASHVRPDGDCIGSQAALASCLRALGKDVRIVNPDAPDERLAFFTDGMGFEVHQGGSLPEHEVSVLLDISELSRCGALAQDLAASDSIKLVIDHHPHSGELWWDACYMDSTASATGVLVHRLAAKLGTELDATAANGIFTAIVSDTGWFRYPNTTAETMEIVGQLVAAGVEPDKVFAALYQKMKPSFPTGLAQILERVQYWCDNRLAVIDLALGAMPWDPQVSDAALDVLRSVTEVQMVIFLVELENGHCKLSARCKEGYDVNALARSFGGGGHTMAAGATIPGSLAEVRAAMVESALKLFDQPAAAPASASTKAHGEGGVA